MRARPPWWLPMAATLGAGVVRVLGATWRYTVSDAPEYTAALARGERFVYAFWHSVMLPLAVLHRHEGIAVLVSRHRDGELITRVIERLGFVAARGSSTRGGEAGVRGMLAWADRGRQLAITPDGPRGPAEQVKDGALYLAERTSRRVVPVAMAARPVRALRSWDRFRVPWPFARVLVAHGAPLEPTFEPTSEPSAPAAPGVAVDVAASAGNDGAADGAGSARARFEQVLADLTRRTRLAIGERV
jgi:lysophospholipid acyltransferase (LPLAT)-like uncharacterized protein